MKRYIFKRTLRLITSFACMVVLIFFIFMSVPGNFVDGIMDPNLTQETIDKLNSKYNLDKSKPERFVIWIKGAIHGDMGVTYTANYKAHPIPVAPMVKSASLSTLKMMFLCIVTSSIIAIPLCFSMVKNSGKKRERRLKIITTIGVSLPAFIIGLLFLGGIKSNKLITSFFMGKGRYREYDAFIAFLVTNAIPFIVLNFIYIANFVKYGFVSLAEIVRSDYIKVAYAMGLKEKRIFYKYALKNALIPLITIVGSSFPIMIGEIMILESAIGRPGLGSLLMNSVNNRQYNPGMMVFVITTFITVLNNYLVDIMYLFVDPRIKISKTAA